MPTRCLHRISEDVYDIACTTSTTCWCPAWPLSSQLLVELHKEFKLSWDLLDAYRLKLDDLVTESIGDRERFCTGGNHELIEVARAATTADDM